MTEHIESTVKTGIARAVEAAGGQSALARLLDGITQQAVQQWERAGYVPTGRVAAVSRLTGVAAVDLLDPRIIEVLETDPVHGSDGGAGVAVEEV